MNKKTAKQNEKETMVEFRSMSSRLQIFSSSCILISFHKSIWSQLSTYIKHIYIYLYAYACISQRQWQTDKVQGENETKNGNKQVLVVGVPELQLGICDAKHKCFQHSTAIQKNEREKTALGIFHNRNTCSSVESFFLHCTAFGCTFYSKCAH